MNNTSRVQSHSNNIIKNFMIAGLSQETLKDRIVRPIREQINIPPEILFSMYTDADDMRQYLKHIFPNKISIEYAVREEIIPRFFTFMCTDAEGINTYFHCLFYYEQINKFDVLHDDDPMIAETIKKLKLRALSRKNRISSSISDLFNDEEEPSEANIGVLDNKLRRMSKRGSRMRF